MSKSILLLPLLPALCDVLHSLPPGPAVQRRSSTSPVNTSSAVSTTCGSIHGTCRDGVGEFYYISTSRPLDACSQLITSSSSAWIGCVISISRNSCGMGAPAMMSMTVLLQLTNAWWIFMCVCVCCCCMQDALLHYGMPDAAAIALEHFVRQGWTPTPATIGKVREAFVCQRD